MSASEVMSASARKRISVTFVGDDDVMQHIIPLNQRKSTAIVTRSRKSVTYAEDIEGSDSEDETEKAVEEDVFKPSQALAVDSGVSGNDVFGFRTPKKAGQMTRKASEVVTAATPKSDRASNSQPQTPRSILKRRRNQVLSESGHTPVGKRGERRCRRLAATTPHRIRARNLREDSSEDSLSSDEDDDDDETGSECSDDVKPVAKKPTKTTEKSVKTPSGGRGKGRPRKDTTDVIEKAVVDAYFDAQSGGSSLTSDRTLSRLECPQMDPETLSRELTHFCHSYDGERAALYGEHKACFRRWMFQLCNGFNLVFHGVGSKRRLLEDFRETMLGDLNHVVVNGYFPSLTIKSILNSITEEVLDHSGSFRTPVEQCDFIRQHYECGDYEDFFLLIHNIDGSMLRGERTQMILSLLAQIRGFHLLASLDHINAPLMWDQNKASRFNWLWYDVTTYESYVDETSYENSLLVQQSGVLALSSLTHVMRSLTSNAKGIFLLLARHQLECAKDNANYQGLSFSDLYQRCREAFLVNSDLTLRTQLTEFKDHKLIKLKKGYDGQDYLMIPLDCATLKEFLEQQETEDS